MNLHRTAIVASCLTLLLASGCSEETEPNRPAARTQDKRADAPTPAPPAPAPPRSPVAEEVDDALRGYVSTTALYIRSGPGTMNPVVGVLVENDPVTITGTKELNRSTWWRIEAAGGYVDGWVSAKFMQHGAPPRTAAVEVGYGERKTPTLVDGPFQYLGVSACRECHLDSTGAHPRGAFPIWNGHLHSEAYASLSRDYTLAIAQRVRGVEDPTTDWRCLKCHVTAFGAAPQQLAPTYKDSDGVGCEVCHGPGSEYAHVDHGASSRDRYALGFKKLTNLDERETLCVSCHNEASPTYKPFNVMAFSREIRHWPDPDDKAYFAQATARAEERRQRLLEGRDAEAETRRNAESRARKAELARQEALRAARSQEEAKRSSAEQSARAAEQAQALELAEVQAQANAKLRAKADAKRAAAEQAADAQRDAAEKSAAAKASAAAEASAAAAARAALEERAAAEAAAKAALAAKKAEEAEQRARQEKLAHEAKRGALTGGPLDKFLMDVPDELTLNKEGVKRDTVRFTHGAHASASYVVGVECQTCHHTQEGDEKPEPCSACHDVGGDAGEENLKSKATHAKKLGFPPTAAEEHVSCVGCHKSQNALLDAGERTGEAAPSKCSLCHAKKGS